MSAKDTECQTGSPEWLIRRLTDARAALVRRLAGFFDRVPGSFSLAVALVIAVLAFYLCAVYFSWFDDDLVWPDGRFLVAFPVFSFSVLLGYLCSKAAPERFSVAILGFSQLLALALCAFVYRVFLDDFLYLTGLVGLLIVLGFVVYRYQERWRLSSNVIFLICFIIGYGLSNLQLAMKDLADHKYFQMYTAFRWVLVIAFPLFAASLATGANERLQLKNCLLFPTAFFYPLPSRLQLWIQKRDRLLASRGLLDVVTGLAFLGVVGAYRYFITNDEGSPLTNSFLFNGLINYLYTYFRSAAIITIPVGLGRMAGYALPDPYVFPLLAPTPQDRWRRWNTYFYDFFMVSTFYPAFKYTRSVFLAVYAVFFLTAVTHAQFISYFSWKNRRATVDKEIFVFFFLHALFVYGGLKTAKLWPKIGRRTGWWGVVITTFLMVLIHFFKLKD